MRFKRITLHNYKQHKDLDYLIDGNIVVVVGPNGRGKSNFLGSFQFAMSGEQAGFDRADLLRWGADEGFVRLEVEGPDGKLATITRNLHNATASFEYGGEKVHGIRGVNEAIAEKLHYDKDLGKQAVFVRQAELDSVLFTDPRARELAFQKLMGIGDAAKIHKKLGEILGALTLPQQYDDQIAEATRRFEELSQRLVGLQTAVDGFKAKRAQCPPIAELQGSVGRMERMLVNLEQLERLQKRRDEALVLQHQHAQELGALPKLTTDLSALDVQIEQLQELVKDAETFHRLQSEWAQAGQAIIQLDSQKPCTPEQLDELGKRTQDVQAQISDLSGRLTIRRELLNTLSKAGFSMAAMTECLLCGSPIQDPVALRSRLEAVVTQLQVQMQAATGADPSKQYMSLMQSNAAYQSRRQTLIQAFQRVEAAFKQAKQANIDVAALKVQIRELQQHRQEFLALESKRLRLSTEHKALYDQHQKLVADVDALLKLMAELGFARDSFETGAIDLLGAYKATQEAIKAAKEQLAETIQLDQQIAAQEGMLAELKASLAVLETTIQTLKQKRDQQSKMTGALATLNRVRDWFHYANGPHTLVSSVLNDMTADVNRFLGQFGAPYTVTPIEQGLGFRYIMHDGTATPPSGPPDVYHLSGGQRIQLAISFRFSSYCVFASKLGVLSLDEPTVYLDEQNVARFCSLLPQIKKVAAGMNLQVLMATHERTVMPYADTVIDLGEA